MSQDKHSAGRYHGGVYVGADGMTVWTTVDEGELDGVISDAISFAGMLYGESALPEDGEDKAEILDTMRSEAYDVSSDLLEEIGDDHDPHFESWDPHAKLPTYGAAEPKPGAPCLTVTEEGLLVAQSADVKADGAKCLRMFSDMACCMIAQRELADAGLDEKVARARGIAEDAWEDICIDIDFDVDVIGSSTVSLLQGAPYASYDFGEGLKFMAQRDAGGPYELGGAESYRMADGR